MDYTYKFLTPICGRIFYIFILFIYKYEQFDKNGLRNLKENERGNVWKENGTVSKETW